MFGQKHGTEKNEGIVPLPFFFYCGSHELFRLGWFQRWTLAFCNVQFSFKFISSPHRCMKFALCIQWLTVALTCIVEYLINLLWCAGFHCSHLVGPQLHDKFKELFRGLLSLSPAPSRWWPCTPSQCKIKCIHACTSHCHNHESCLGIGLDEAKIAMIEGVSGMCQVRARIMCGVVTQSEKCAQLMRHAWVSVDLMCMHLVTCVASTCLSSLWATWMQCCWHLDGEFSKSNISGLLRVTCGQAWSCM